VPVPPTHPVAPISPGEMQLLLSRAGLVLNPGQVADLVLAWRQVAGLIASLPHDRPLADDMALAFRLPPAGAGLALTPVAVGPAGEAPAVKRRTPAAKAKAKPKRPAAKAVAKGKAKAKAKGKSAAKRPAPRKQARRRR